MLFRGFSGWEAFPRDLWLFGTCDLCACVGACVLVLGPGEDGHKCFIHHIYMTTELAFQTLIWDLGLFTSVQSIGFGALIKMIKISQSISMWSNYFNCLNTGLVWSFSAVREAWHKGPLLWTFLGHLGHSKCPYAFQNEIRVEKRWTTCISVFSIHLLQVMHPLEFPENIHTI